MRLHPGLLAVRRANASVKEQQARPRVLVLDGSGIAPRGAI
jgi:deoxyinosine 3'endonuclease (endonuclease V)